MAIDWSDLVHEGVERAMRVAWAFGLLGGFAIGWAAAISSNGTTVHQRVVVGIAGVVLLFVGIWMAYRTLPAARTIVAHYEEVDDGGE